jgi:hypothetical protein
MTAVRSADYKLAVMLLENDNTVIKMARDAAKYVKPEVSQTYWFVSNAHKEYIAKGSNLDAANHHIGAVAEAIRSINGWSN